ncbi:class I SAM-dependent methyltransferase [Methylorubrum populi]|nr:class I SAM-dependent methyltransferase [Methylorubrum populi]
MAKPDTNEDDRSHWDRFYKKYEPPHIPSQFAVFTCAEFTGASFLIDIGCGNGRDLIFFSSKFEKVVGVDESEKAIDILVKSGKLADQDCCINAPINSPTLAASLKEKLGDMPENSFGVIYARFFLHAIRDADELAFWELCKTIANWRDVSIAVEFRSAKDRSLPKMTPDHFRRYIAPADFIASAAFNGFAVIYYVEGFGFAKYGSDDAHVARILLQRSAWKP